MKSSFAGLLSEQNSSVNYVIKISAGPDPVFYFFDADGPPTSNQFLNLYKKKKVGIKFLVLVNERVDSMKKYPMLMVEERICKFSSLKLRRYQERCKIYYLPAIYGHASITYTAN